MARDRAAIERITHTFEAKIDGETKRFRYDFRLACYEQIETAAAICRLHLERMTRGIRDSAEMMRMREHTYLSEALAWMFLPIDEEGNIIGEWDHKAIAKVKEFIRRGLTGADVERLEECRLNFFTCTGLRRTELELLSAKLQGVQLGASLLTAAELRRVTASIENTSANKDSEEPTNESDE